MHKRKRMLLNAGSLLVDTFSIFFTIKCLLFYQEYYYYDYDAAPADPMAPVGRAGFGKNKKKKKKKKDWKNKTTTTTPEPTTTEPTTTTEFPTTTQFRISKC